MALSFSRPDPSSPDAVASASFSTSRRGYDQTEVRDLLRMVAAEMARLQEREKFLERELRTVAAWVDQFGRGARRRSRHAHARRRGCAHPADGTRGSVTDQDPLGGRCVSDVARGHRRSPAIARRGRGRGRAASSRRVRRCRVRVGDGQAAGPRDGQRGARRIASVCSASWRVAASSPASRSSN